MVPALSSLPQQPLLLKAGGVPDSTLAFNQCVEKKHSLQLKGEDQDLCFTKVLTLYSSIVW